MSKKSKTINMELEIYTVSEKDGLYITFLINDYERKLLFLSRNSRNEFCLNDVPVDGIQCVLEAVTRQMNDVVDQNGVRGSLSFKATPEEFEQALKEAYYSQEKTKMRYTYQVDVKNPVFDLDGHID